MLGDNGVRIPDKDIEIILKEVDMNEDNVIDYGEFLEMMKMDLKV